MSAEPSSPVKSVLHDVQEARGATFRDDDGWYWTMSFGDGTAGYDALRDGTAIWDVYPMVRRVVTGAESAAAIQRVFTNDLSKQQVGQVKYGAFTEADGTIVDDGTVFKLADDHWWVFTNTNGFSDWWAGKTEGLDFVSETVTTTMPLIAVQGPTSRTLLQGLTDVDLAGLKYFRFLPERIEVAGVQAWVMRTGFTGELGFELIPDAADAVTLWNALEAAGAVPMGLDTIEPARVEAGLVIYGRDYEPGVHTPIDVSLDPVVLFTDGLDYLGKDVLAKAAAAPTSRLKTLVFEGSELPEGGADVLVDGVVVGTLTSPAASPRLGLIGLARVAPEAAEDGTTVQVRHGSGTVGATVAPLCVKDPEKRLARS